MNGLTRNDLHDLFEQAVNDGSRCIFVEITAEGVREVICIPRAGFDEKLEFYNRTYTDELRHIMNKRVMITSLSHGGPDQLEHLIYN